MNGTSSDPSWIPLAHGGEALVRTVSGSPSSTVVIFGELFGITALVTDALERLSRAGYTAVAPDIYWREGTRLALPYDDQGRQRGFDILGNLRIADVCTDVEHALRAIAAPTDRPLHLLGFSSGGNIALHLAGRMDARSVVAVYPGWTLHATGPLEVPAPLERPDALGDTDVTIIAGTGDSLVMPDLPGVRSALGSAGVRHDIVEIPGAPHGYACPDRLAGFDADATAITWQTILSASTAMTNYRWSGVKA